MAEEVRAEMVSTVLTVEVAVGEKVDVDQTLVLLESMKMEIPVISEVSGEVTSIAVAPGQVLQQGDLIAVIS
ncbi:biotin/lipoyl-binding carrier protein [Nocardia sp. NPDC052566]|uniref:biotin/lipoyl-binding carrier protein n=1 Tax=Nocardia sp. NPDC052566 TaxID=3364330 RepID=UPI0037C9063C